MVASIGLPVVWQVWKMWWARQGQWRTRRRPHNLQAQVLCLGVSRGRSIEVTFQGCQPSMGFAEWLLKALEWFCWGC